MTADMSTDGMAVISGAGMQPALTCLAAKSSVRAAIVFIDRSILGI